jgi:polyphosphate kinase 2 (PPK2 family)
VSQEADQGASDFTVASEGTQPKLKREEYEKQLRKLQTELCSLQDWVKQQGERIIVVFEGRDAAGKGGTIRAMTERVSPRTFRLVALPAPSECRCGIRHELLHRGAAQAIP